MNYPYTLQFIIIGRKSNC